MTESVTPPDADPPAHDMEPLSSKQRWLAGSAALATAGAGAVATFMDGSNTGGAPLLIGVGALFGYLALTGQKLTRLEAGGAKAELARTRRVIEEVATDPSVSDEVKGELAEAVREQRVFISSPAREALLAASEAQVNGTRFTLEVESAISRLRPDLRVMLERPHRFPDLTLSDGQRTLPVEVLYTSRETFPRGRLMQRARRLQDGDAECLLIINRPVDRGGEALFVFLESNRVYPAIYNEQMGDEQLRGLLQQMFPG